MPRTSEIRFDGAVLGFAVAAVVGVAEDVRCRELTSARPSLYVPIRQQRFPYGPHSLALRTDRDTAHVIAQVRSLLRSVDPTVRVLSVATIQRLLDAPSRVRASTRRF